MAVDTMSTPAMVSTAPAKRSRESQFGLMWRRFKRHKLALVSLWIVGAFYLVALLAEFIAPVDPAHYSARYTYAPPQGLHLFAQNPLRPAVRPAVLPESMEAFGISGRYGSGLKRLFMSHPPIPERIAALEQSH